MIEQTYYPFGGDFDSFSTSSSNSYNEDSGSNWFAWFLLIATLIGVAGVVYWWREKIS